MCVRGVGGGASLTVTRTTRVVATATAMFVLLVVGLARAFMSEFIAAVVVVVVVVVGA